MRWGVTKGLAYEKSLGANPYHYGFVGGTDNHNGMPSNVDEDNFAVGSHGAADGTVERRRTGEIGGWLKGPDLEPRLADRRLGAAEHPRGDLGRPEGARDASSTSGPRIKVRFFGRLGAGEAPADAKSLVESRATRRACRWAGRSTGGSGAPSFTVWAMKEPDGANLDRIQIVKGWVDAKGEPQDRVVRRRLVRRPQAGQERQGARGREHRRHDEGHLHQHDRQRRS